MIRLGPEAEAQVGRYWIAYSTVPTPTIVAVVFETANIPGHR
jgi:hypothetical protein